jgi:hydroxypyruvate isomerase
MDRRTFLGNCVATAGVGGLLGSAAAQAPAAPPTSPAPAPTPSPAGAPRPRLKQSVCRWCFSGMPLDELCRHAAAMGYRSVELLDPSEWDVPRRHGLVCALANAVKSNPIPRGFNRPEHHDAIVRDLEERLPLVKAAGVPMQIVFSGNRAGLSDSEGLKHCAAGLKRITPLAESLGVTLVMELLNSKVDHRDYQCDRTPWGVALVSEVASPRFKLLYDIYHMQIMEGDVIRTITDHHAAIAHYHTAGVPGRHELDATQELHYPAICRAIAATGFEGYLAQEFIPRADPLGGLRDAFNTCNV